MVHLFDHFCSFFKIAAYGPMVILLALQASFLKLGTEYELHVFADMASDRTPHDLQSILHCI
jgi:hypothetical protein